MSKAKEAVFDLVYPSYYDKGDQFSEYESKQDAIDDLIDVMGYSYYGLEVFEADGGEYAVAESSSEAEDAAIESVKSLLDDIGIDGFNLGYLGDYVDEQWFVDAEREMHESYAQDIQSESSSDEDLYVNRLHEELCDAGLMYPLDLPEAPEESDFEEDENGASDEYERAYGDWEGACLDLVRAAESEAEDKIYELAEHMMSNDSVEYYIDNFGEADFNETVKRHNLADEDKIAQYVVDTDGCGHILAQYDGDEYEENGCLIYRIN